MNTLKNVVFSLCIGSIVAITVNMRVATDYKFNSTALALGFFVFSAMFVIKPIKVKRKTEKVTSVDFRRLSTAKDDVLKS